MAKDHHPKSNNSLFSSIRRSFLRNAPASIVEEMRPILLSSKKGDTSNSSSNNNNNTSSSGTGNSHHNNHGVVAGTYEFSVRDHSDASAKRGFRVQVPKRILCYTLVVFFILPLVLFLYVELHRQSLKRQAARYHSYDTSKVLPIILRDELDPREDPMVHPDDPRPMNVVQNATLWSPPDIVHSDNTAAAAASGITDSIDTPNGPNDAPLLAPTAAGVVVENEDKGEDSQEGGDVVAAAANPSLQENELLTNGMDHGLENKHDLSIEPRLPHQQYGNSSTDVSSLNKHGTDGDGSVTSDTEEHPSSETSNTALEEFQNVTATTTETLDEESIPTGGFRRYLRALSSRVHLSS